MYLTFMFMLMSITNILILGTLSPLPMGLLIIAHTIMVAIYVGFILPSFWFSFIIILILLGGLLVLFIYVASLAPNEQINLPSYIPIAASFGVVAILMFTFTPMNKIIIVTDNFYSNQNFIWLFSSSNLYISIFLMVYLFIALIAITKITKWWGGSLRPMKN